MTLYLELLLREYPAMTINYDLIALGECLRRSYADRHTTTHKQTQATVDHTYILQRNPPVRNEKLLTIAASVFHR